METNVVCLHENLHLMDQCVDLLNSEWPRSKTARRRGLEPGPPDSFPTSLLLISKQNKKESVIGHSKILPMPQNKEACFVASVVIQKSLRGKGLGRLLMEKTEEFVKKKGVKEVFLSTHDQQEFYRRLGYELYDYTPVVIFGGRVMDMYKLFGNEDNIEDSNGNNHDVSPSVAPPEECQGPKSRLVSSPPANAKSQPPAPPPPPLPKTNNKVSIISSPSQSDIKVHMKKTLA